MKMAFFTQNRPKKGIDNHRLISHIIPNIPKGGEMALRKSNHRLSLDFFQSTFDLKKHVFINARKQIGQKREGVSASQF